MKKLLFVLSITFVFSSQVFAQWQTSADGTTQETPQDVSIADGNILLTNVGANRGAIDLFDQDNEEYLRLYSSGGDGYIRMMGGNPKGIRFFPGNTESVYFSANGRVGIGTANPEASMDIRRAGTIGGVWGPERAYLQLSDGTVSMIMDGNEITTNNVLYFGANRGFRFMKVEEQSNTALLEITRYGNVGIGTTTPDSKLTVVGNVNIGGESNHHLKVRHINGKHWQTSEFHNLHLNYQQNFPVLIGFGGAESDLLVSGNVGIGITNPTHKLHLSGTAQIDYTGVNAIQMGHVGVSGGLQAIGSNSNGDLILSAHLTVEGHEHLTIQQNTGNVGIGTTDPQAKLAVDGDILATKVKVVADVNTVPDYVFDEDYDLSSLDEVADYIGANQHLPEVPSAQEMAESGQDLGEMNLLLLKKVEELTLYLIEKDKEMQRLKEESELVKDLAARLEVLESQFNE